MTMLVITLLALLGFHSAAAAQDQSVTTLLTSLETRDELKPLKTVVVARDGETIAEKGYRGHTPSESTNIKSASKSIVSALVGIAIDKGLLDGPEQKIAPLLKEDLPSQADPPDQRHHHRQPAFDAGGIGADVRTELRPLGV